MANFTPEQVEYIEKTIALAIGRQSEQIGTLMTEDKAQQDEMRALIVKHNQEVHGNANRVSALVDNAFTAAAKV